MREVCLTLTRVWGLGRGWLVALPLVWASVPALASVALPRIDPDPAVQSRPLEQLSTMALVLTVSHTCWLLGDGASWLTATSPRHVAGHRLLRAGLLLVVGTAVVTQVAQTLPAEVETRHTVVTWHLLLGLGMAGTALLGRVWASALPALAVLFASVAGPTAWRWNVVYNLDADPLLGTAAIATLVLGAGLYARIGERSGRRAVLADRADT